MGINGSAVAYERAQEFERREIRVLDGKQAKARENKRRADIAKIAVAASAVLLYLLAVTFMSAQVCSVGVEINQLQAAISETNNMTARAELELGQLASLDRVEAYVADNLAMVRPTASDVYILDEQSSLAIAMGQQQLANSQNTAMAEVEDSGFWSSVSSFLFGTAKAAEND